MPYVLGIDIGGTTTTAAVSRLDASGWGLPEAVRLGQRSHAVPSVLHLAADGSLTVGDPVQVDPGRVARGFIWRIGDEVPVIVGDEPWPAQALTAVLAHWVVNRVAAWEGGPATQIVVSHPAVWGSYRRTLLRRALAEVGLAAVQLVPEPVLAAECHAAGGWTGGVLAVYSLGGSQVETSVVRWADGFGFRLLGRAAPAEPLGGVDLDEALADHVRAGLGKEFRALGAGAQARLALFGLRWECMRAKERLTTATETEVLVPLPPGQVPVPVTRARLAELARPALQVTVDSLAQTVHACGLRGHQLDGVLLVGGAARMPLVAELVGAVLPGQITVEPEAPGMAVSGAAVAAGRLATSPRPARPPQRPPLWRDESSGVEPVSPEPGAAPEAERRAGPPPPPPPRPPVRVAPLEPARPRRFGLVGGRS